MENIPDESKSGRDHLEVLQKIAKSLPLSEAERVLLDALIRGERVEDMTEKLAMSRASCYRLRAKLFMTLRKEKERFWEMVG